MHLGYSLFSEELTLLRWYLNLLLCSLICWFNFLMLWRQLTNLYLCCALNYMVRIRTLVIFFAVCKLFYCTSRFYHLPFPDRLLSPFLPVSQPVNCLEKWQQNLNLICEYVEWLLSPCSYSFYFTHMYRCTFVFSIATTRQSSIS